MLMEICILTLIYFNFIKYKFLYINSLIKKKKMYYLEKNHNIHAQRQSNLM